MMDEKTTTAAPSKTKKSSSSDDSRNNHHHHDDNDDNDDDDRPASKRMKRQQWVETKATTATTARTTTVASAVAVAVSVTEERRTTSTIHPNNNSTSTSTSTITHSSSSSSRSRSVAVLDNKSGEVVPRNSGDTSSSSSIHEKNNNNNHHGKKEKEDTNDHTTVEDDDSHHETTGPLEKATTAATTASQGVVVTAAKEEEKRENNQDDDNDDNDDDDDDKEEEVDDDDDDDFPLDEDETVALQQILAAARARGIPLEFLAQLQDHHANHNEDDNAIVSLPYDPPQSLQDVAKYIQSETCQNILILAGAGMSVASGIPDFRSSNGLYATLDATKLSCNDDLEEHMIAVDPSYALDHDLFLENPLPCLEVNRAFCLGMYQQRWKATLAHRLLECLCRHYPHKVTRLYTQNIDGLEDQCDASLPQRRIAVHGSMDQAKCAVCDTSMPMDEFCHRLQRQIKDWTGQDPTAPSTSTPIVCPHCHRPTVKPNIVLFRSSLPKVFFESVPHDTQTADLLLILGTSLGVAPANSLVWRVPKTCMRVLLNKDPVGQMVGLNFAQHARDYWAAGTCEDLALELLQALGWLEDLRPLLEPNKHDGTMKLPQASHDLLRQAFEKLDSKKEAAVDQSTNHEVTDRNGNPTSTGEVDGDSKPSAVSS